MKIAPIGATGRIGRYIPREARERGHEVLALVRSGGAAEVGGAATREADIFSVAGLAWTCVAPAVMVGPGGRTGRYRSALGMLVRDAQECNAIFYEDFALALVGELASGQQQRQVLAVGN